MSGGRALSSMLLKAAFPGALRPGRPPGMAAEDVLGSPSELLQAVALLIIIWDVQHVGLYGQPC